MIQTSVGSGSGFGGLADEAFRVAAIGSIENELAVWRIDRGLAVVDHGWGQQADPGVAMLFVVPAERTAGRRRGCLGCSRSDPGTPGDTSWCGTGFPNTDCRRRRVGPAVGLGDAQIGQQKGHRLGAHDRAAVGMDGELAGRDDLFCASLLDELLGQFGAFARRDHPAGDVAAEDVEDDVEIEVGPLGRTAAAW